jgi:hypothetical protein
MMIYETDTDRVLVWHGSAWDIPNPAGTTRPNFLCYFAGANGSAVNNATIAYTHELYDDTNSVTSGIFTVPSGQAGTYMFSATGNVYNIGTSGYFRINIQTTGSTNGLHGMGSQVLAQGSTDVVSNANLLVKLAVGDTVRCVWVVPATGNYSAGLAWNTFSGVRVA